MKLILVNMFVVDKMLAIIPAAIMNTASCWTQVINTNVVTLTKSTSSAPYWTLWEIISNLSWLPLKKHSNTKDLPPHAAKPRECLFASTNRMVNLPALVMEGFSDLTGLRRSDKSRSEQIQTPACFLPYDTAARMFSVGCTQLHRNTVTLP